MKVKKTYRIEQEVADKLAKLADERGVTATEILEGAIRAYGTEPDVSHTSEAAYELLREQLQVKDKQIAELLEALRGAQALHAVDKRPELVGASDNDGDVPLSWWQRFKVAWKESRNGR